jgi:hypothetical protein
MKSFLLLLTAICLSLVSCNENPRNLPEPMGDDEIENLKKRERWFEAIHRAAPGTNWRNIEASNRIAASQIRQTHIRDFGRNPTAESFAGGAITGTWAERGSSNVAGSIRAVEYDAPTNNIYTISDGGTLWRGNLAGTSWTVLNDDYQFGVRALSVFNKVGGGRRIIAPIGQDVYWSDNEGATFTQSTGISYPVAWGGNFVSDIITLNDASKTVYVLTYNWDNTLGFEPRHYLYRSTDQGASFTRINIFTNGNQNGLGFVNPYNSNLLYAADVTSVANRIALYEINAATVTPIASSLNVPTGSNCQIEGTVIGSTLTLYVLKDVNQLYVRQNTVGSWSSDWAFASNTPTSAWNKFDCGMSNAANVYYGEVDMFRSTNGGTSFSRVNNWYEYYGQEITKLHADMMEMKHFKKTDNTVFQLINHHGGVSVSYDNCVTTTNISATGLHSAQLYDLITDTLNTNRMYLGTQDQGIQRNVGALTPGVLNFTQFLSGDYGFLTLTQSGTRLWAVYPGSVYYFPDPLTPGPITGNRSNWDIPGTTLGNYGWMPPVKNTESTTANEIYVGGGNISGGSGSYLIKLSTTSTEAPATFSATQGTYDFRANSNNGTSSITSIEVSRKDAGKIYVAAEDGTFFYTNNNGTTWNKTPSFSGTTGFYIYGQAILASKKTSGLVWYGGSGYSNPGVFKSTNGGASFTAMNNGLPSTLVNELATNDAETMIFAATDAGPYVYIVANNQWYSLIGASTPLQDYRSVEYVRSLGLVRFGTYGRGVWDLKIETSLPVTGLSLAANLTASKTVDLQWTTQTEINNSHFLLQRSADGNNYQNITRIAANGNGNSNTLQQYAYNDGQPFSGVNYYRVEQVDKDGKSQFSKVVRVNREKGVELVLSPNPVKDRFSISPNNKVTKVQVFDVNGRLLKTFNNSVQYDLSELPTGNYVISVLEGKSISNHKIAKQ